MRLLRNQQISNEEWNSILVKGLNGSAFQTPTFYKLCNQVKGLAAEAFGLEENNSLKGLCVVTIQKESGLKGYFSRRAIIYGGPVIKNLEEEAFGVFMNWIKEQLKHIVIYLEIRNYFDYKQFHDHYLKLNFKWVPYLNIRLSIKEKSLDDVLLSMKYNRKREIRLSLTESAVYREALNLFEVERLYGILKELYLQKVKLPLPNLEFFQAIYKSTIGKVFIVLHDNNIIGGSFCLYSKNKAIYTMYYCGLRSYKKNIYPTHLSILAAVEFAINNDLEYLDFMGAGLSGKDYGVRKYKLEFGGELVEQGRYIKINNQILYRTGRIALKILKLLRR